MNPKSIVSSSTIASLTHKLSLSMIMLSALITPAWGIKPEITDIEDIDDKVTLQIQVTGEESKPIMGLAESDFQLKVLDKKNNKTYQGKQLPFDWKSPRETTPPDAWIVVLIDFSGSMNCSQALNTKCDAKAVAKGKRKLDAAINALGTFIKFASERKGNTYLSIVPFGVEGKNDKPGACDYYPKVTSETLDNFSLVQDVKLTNFLGSLANKTPCATTNFYQALKETVKFFKNDKEGRFYPKDKEGKPLKPQPRLSIILLSDGFDNNSNYQEIQKTLANLQNNKDIVVHTLGYGLTPQQLGKKYSLGKPAVRGDINNPKLSQETREQLEKEFVDQKQLAEIAKLTGGVTEFAGDADEIAEKLEIFLDAIQGRYEISYIQPNVRRGGEYVATVSTQKVASQSKPYTLDFFGRTLPLETRILMLICIFLALGLGGVIPFYYWGKWLKEKQN